MRGVWTALTWLVGTATLAGTGGYVIVYLVRWEWHRAILVALLFLAVEIALATALLLRTRGRAAPPPGADEGRLLEHLERTRPVRNHFAWLRPSDRTGVFIPVLLGVGVLVSAAALALERLAAATGGRVLERDLARELAGIAFPAGGLVADDAELVAQEFPYADDPGLRVLLAPPGRAR